MLMALGGPDVSDVRRLCQLWWLADALPSPRSWLVGARWNTQQCYLGYEDFVARFENAVRDYLRVGSLMHQKNFAQ